jgi:hypothetical protein
MLVVVFLIAVIYMSSKLIKKGVDMDTIQELILETHKYSGINEILYKEFLANINMAREYKAHDDISRKLLERAMNNLEELALYTTASDTTVVEEVDDLIVRITSEFELLYRRT